MAAAERKDDLYASTSPPSFQRSNSWRLRRLFCRRGSKVSRLEETIKPRRGPPVRALVLYYPSKLNSFVGGNVLVVGTRQRRRSRGIANHQLRVHLVPRDSPIALLKAGIHTLHNDVHGMIPHRLQRLPHGG